MENTHRFLFRTDKATFKKLHKIAIKKDWSVNTLINGILEDFLLTYQPKKSAKKVN